MQTRPLFSGRMSPQATTFTPPIASLNLTPFFYSPFCCLLSLVASPTPSLDNIALLCFPSLASLAFSLSFASLPFLSGTFYDPRCSLRNPLLLDFLDP